MKYYLTLLAAALMLVACNKENGGETPDPNTTKVSFENIADLDIEKTTWVITGEATEEQWLAMLVKMAEVQNKGEEYYGTIDVVMPDITECPKIVNPFCLNEDGHSLGGYNRVMKSFSAPNLVRLGYYMFRNCMNLKSVSIPKATKSYSYSGTTEEFTEIDYLLGVFYYGITPDVVLEELDVSSATSLANHFTFNSGLKDIHLPNVTYLTGGTFARGVLENIYLTTSEDITLQGNSAFYGIKTKVTVYVSTETNRAMLEEHFSKNYLQGSGNQTLISEYVTVKLLDE